MTDAEAEAPVMKLQSWNFGLLMQRANSLEKNPNVGKDWEQKWATEDEMVGWHHWLNGLQFEQALGDDEGQGGLEHHSPWGLKELDVTKWLN